MVLCVAALCGGCGDGPDQVAGTSAHTLPPLELAPHLDLLRAIASAQPAPPDEQARAELAELVEASFSSDASETMQQQALEWLLAHERARFALEEGLRHAEPGVRSHCAYQLGLLGDRTAIPLLLWRERQEQGIEPACWIIGALASLGNLSGLPRLATMLTDSAAQAAATPVVDRILGEARRTPPERTWEALGAELATLHEEWLARRRAAPATEEEPALRGRLAALLVGLEEFQLRPVDEARTVFTRLSVVPSDLLRLALSAEERYLRVHSIEIVRELGRAGAPLGEALLPLLRDPVARPYAVEALGEVGYAPAAPHFVELLRGEDLELRVAAASALGPLGDLSAVVPLRATLNDATTPMDVRVRAAFSLACLDASDAGEGFLRERLDRGDYHAPTIRELLDRLERDRRAARAIDAAEPLPK
ncbi:MAG: hypothetical protein GY711_32050 [bacterium]|nr:hypothetical protein [bacterium]